jgi:uncharacterized protein YvpB
MKQAILAGMSISERLIIKMHYCLRQPLTVLVFSLTFLMAVSPSPTFAKASLPPLASTYQGTVHNTTFDHTATLTLTSLVQNQGAISGNVIIGSGLNGSGPFTGTIMSNRSISFTDVSTDGSNVTIFFTGSLYGDGSLSGTYTIPSTEEEGTWQVIPSPTVDLQTLAIQPFQPLLANSNPTFRATIRNNGSAASGNFNIRWIADGKVFDGGHASILAGTVDTHDHIWNNITVGKHTLTFIANFDHTIAETTTRNNQTTLTFTVRSDVTTSIVGSSSVRLSVPFLTQIGSAGIPGSGSNNCGPASVAMSINFFGNSVTVNDAAIAIRNGPNNAGNGTTNFKEIKTTNYLARYGLHPVSVSTYSEVQSELALHHPVIILVNNNTYRYLSPPPYSNNNGGWFTTAHIIVVTGYDGTNVYINDPLRNAANYVIPVATFKSAASTTPSSSTTNWYAESVSH